MSRPEFDLIARIRSRTGSSPRVPLGIGDDAAALLCDPDREVLVATDMLLDGVHFRITECGYRLAGRKTLAVNLSDIAAMGGRPVAAFVSVALSRGMSASDADELHQGILDLCQEVECVLAGGDTNAWDGPLAVNIAVVGESIDRTSIRRAGARVGDAILLTGATGGSINGRHLIFEPRLKEADFLVKSVRPNSMIDISDGLAADLHHILEESGVGAVLNAAAIPIHEDLNPGTDNDWKETAVQDAARSPLKPGTVFTRALSDGEDFELLLTLPEDRAQWVLENWPFPCGITRIGTVTSGNGCRLVFSGVREVVLPPLGYVHGNIWGG